jgi:hypothetical protein
MSNAKQFLNCNTRWRKPAHSENWEFEAWNLFDMGYPEIGTYRHPFYAGASADSKID